MRGKSEIGRLDNQKSKLPRDFQSILCMSPLSLLSMHRCVRSSGRVGAALAFSISGMVREEPGANG